MAEAFAPLLPIQSSFPPALFPAGRYNPEAYIPNQDFSSPKWTLFPCSKLFPARQQNLPLRPGKKLHYVNSSGNAIPFPTFSLAGRARGKGPQARAPSIPEPLAAAPLFPSAQKTQRNLPIDKGWYTCYIVTTIYRTSPALPAGRQFLLIPIQNGTWP